jgi:RNA polymerase sigma factor (sigma-70 family)
VTTYPMQKPGDPSPDRTGPRLFAHRGRRSVSSPGVPESRDDVRGDAHLTAAALLRDRELLHRWRCGDAAAGVTLLDSYAAYVRRIAGRLGVCVGDFEEFWQDLVLRLMEQLPTLQERLRTSFAGYLAWQVRDLVRNARRKSRLHTLPEIETATSDLEAPAVRSAFWEALGACAEQLPPMEQKVFELRFLSGLDLGEVAARVGSNANAVAQAVFRLTRRLRDGLTAKGFDGPGDLT